MNLKVIGCIFVFACGVASGFVFAHRLSSRVFFLEEFVRFMLCVETNLQYSLVPIPELMSSFKSDILDYVFALFQENFLNGATFQEAWVNAINQIPKSCGIVEEDKRIIGSFVFGLGTSDAHTQISHCRLYKDFIMKNLNDAKEKQKSLSKVYVMCGAAISAFFCLLF